MDWSKFLIYYLCSIEISDIILLIMIVITINLDDISVFGLEQIVYTSAINPMYKSLWKFHCIQNFFSKKTEKAFCFGFITFDASVFNMVARSLNMIL